MEPLPPDALIQEVGSGAIDYGDIPMEMSDKPFKMPTAEELLGMLDSMGLGDQEKEELRAALMAEDPVPEGPAGFWSSQAFILLSFLLLVASIFAFFGYKLYKSLKDKELRREEKRKMKQLKKRK